MVYHWGYDKNYLTTAWFIQIMTDWFNYCTSRSKIFAFSRSNQKAYGKAIKTLETVFELFETCKFEKDGWKPLQTGMRLSTKSMLDLQKKMLDEGLSHLLTARFSQDKCENLFSCIRSKSATPTPLEFKMHLKMVTMTQYFREVKNSNYLSDGPDESLADFLDNPTFKAIAEEDLVNGKQQARTLSLLAPKNTTNDVFVSKIVRENLYYVAGYIIHSVLQNQKTCYFCTLPLTQPAPFLNTDEIARVTVLKDYTGSSLKYCSKNVFEKIFLPTEKFFQSIDFERISTAKFVQNSLPIVMAQTPANLLPDCHNLRKKLLKSFLIMRCRSTLFQNSKSKRKMISKKRAGGEKGSKSMLMKKLVNELK